MRNTYVGTRDGIFRGKTTHLRDYLTRNIRETIFV